MIDKQWEARNSKLGRVLLFFARRRFPIVSRVFMAALGSEILCRVNDSIVLPHPYGIILHPDVVLGNDILIQHQVTIGQNLFTGDVGAPVIEEGVYIGPGAKVLGPITVGAAAIIGANAVVTRDVPSGRTVVGANRLLPVDGSDAEGCHPGAGGLSPVDRRLVAGE